MKAITRILLVVLGALLLIGGGVYRLTTPNKLYQ